LFWVLFDDPAGLGCAKAQDSSLRLSLRGDPFPTIGALVRSRTGALPAKLQRERLVQTTSLLPMVESRPPQSLSLEQEAVELG